MVGPCRCKARRHKDKQHGDLRNEKWWLGLRLPDEWTSYNLRQSLG